jgi:hypothetical protein
MESEKKSNEWKWTPEMGIDALPVEFFAPVRFDNPHVRSIRLDV